MGRAAPAGPDGRLMTLISLTMTIQISPRGTRGVELPPIARAIFGVVSPVFIALFPLLRNLIRFQGRSALLLLTTVGAKTGKKRQTVLFWFPDVPESPDSWMVIGSGGGSSRHPSWFINLARNPDQVWIDAGGRHTRVIPSALEGEERDEAMRRMVAAYPGYGQYNSNTDRVIPIVRLRAVAD